MNVDELIADLAAEDIAIWLEAGELRFRAPRGAMTPQRRAVLREHREAIRSRLADDRVPQVTGTDEAHRHEPFPLSDLQAAYLVGRGDLYEHGGVACHAYIELGYAAELSPERVCAAWNALVTRHDMLRALVHADGYQVVLADPPRTPIDVADLRGQGPDAGRARIEAVRAELGHRVARTDRWPLCVPRITWLDDALVVHLSLDLLVVDYASAQLLLAELDQLCTDGGTDAALPPLAVTFRDYVLARRAVSETAGYQRDRAYWLGRLDTLPAGPELPAVPTPTEGAVDGATAGAGAARFDHLEHLLTAAEWDQLRETARSHGLTVSTVLLTAYAEVIGRWSRNTRFALNLPVFQRLPVHPGIDAVVGEFTAVELLAVDLTEPAGFADRATTVSAQLIEDLSHPLFTGSEVLAELAHRTGQRPLMPVVFTSTLDTAPQSAAASTVRYAISQTPQVWVDCQVMPRAGGLSLSWDVRRGVLPDGLAEAAFGSYVEAVRRLAADPAVWTGPAPVTLPDAQRAARRAVNDTTGPVPGGLLHEGVLAQTARTPDAVAVSSARRDLTYRELAAEARAVAARLTAAGVGPAEPVAVGMDKGWEQIVGVLGVHLAGAAYLPVDTSQPAARRAAILTDAGVRVLLTQPWLAESAGWPAIIEVLDVTAPTGPAPATPTDTDLVAGNPPADPGDLAYVIYTSGSTGTPKGVMISHRAALNTVVDINSRFKVGPGDAVLGLASLGFDLSVYDVFGPLSVGARLVLPEADRRADPSHWAELVRGAGVTIWNSVPGQLQMLAEFLRSAPEVEAGLPTLRLAMLSGDWIPVPLPDEIRRLVPGLAVVSLGGATEGAIWSIVHPIGVVDRGRPSIPYGTPLANQTFHVLDPAMRDRPDWVPGELYIGGTGVALGYLGDARRTAERFVDHPVTGERLYRTGDLGRYHPDGSIEFLGREDDQVKIRGYRIELAEVETAVLANPQVGAAAVVVDDTGPSGRRLAAFVEPAHLTDDDLRAAYFPATDAQAAGDDAAEAAHRDATGDANGDAEPVDPRALDRFLAAMDDVALGLMARTLADESLPARPAPLDPEAVCAGLRATPTSAHVVRRWLRALVDTGRLDPATGALAAGTVPDDGQLAALWKELDDAEAAVSYGTDLVEVMRTCAAHLPALVSGELDIRALLFPGADTDVLAAAYRDNLALRHLHRGAVAGARRIAALHAAGPRADEPLRVLEVGGGVAATTAELVPALAEFGVDYLYTDPSRFFVREAEPRFLDFPWVRFTVFDPAVDPRPQGLTPNSFDVVVCPNVLHSASDIPGMLATLTELLAPGGWLLVMENARDDHHPLLVSLEFLEATSGPRTDLRAAAGQSFLTDPQWAAVLADAGADVAAALPYEDHPLHRTGQRLFLARTKTDRVPVSPVTLARHTADQLPEYMVPAAWQVVDALPRTGNGKTDRARLTGWLPQADSSAAGAGRSAEPADVLESQLAGLWAELLGVARIGRHDDFFALGGDSLLVARMVGQVRERIPDVVALEWEVVLRHLLRQPTVAALAEFLRTATALGPAGRDGGAGTGAGSGSGGPGGATGSALVELHGDGLADPAAPITVLVHAGTGTLMPYRALVTEIRRRSAGTAALIGLEVPDLNAYLDAEPTGQVEALAAGYVRGLLDLPRDATGHREIHLVGYCLGGLIALEVARGLAEAGVPPASLTAISSHSPRFRLDDALLAEYSFAVMMGINPPDIGFPADETEVARASEAVLADTPGVLRDGGMAELNGPFTDIAARFRELADTPREERVERMCRAVPASAGMYTPEHMTRLLRTFQQSVFSISRYLPEPYAGDVTFLRHSGTYPFPGSKEAVTAQWEEVCLGDLRIIDVPGDHFTCLSVEHSPGVLRLVGGLTSGAVTR